MHTERERSREKRKKKKSWKLRQRHKKRNSGMLMSSVYHAVWVEISF